MPKLLPLPFGRAVRVPLVPVMLAFQLFCRVWPLPRLMVTTQLLVPLTEKFTLNRSDHDSPGLTLTVQPPPPPPPPGGGWLSPPPPPPAAPPAVGVLLVPLRQTVLPTGCP